MKKLLIVLLLIHNTCFAYVTHMNAEEFVSNFSQQLNGDIQVIQMKYFDKLSGHDVYKVFFNNNVNSRMYLCCHDDNIVQILFMSGMDEISITHELIKMQTALNILGVNNNVIKQCIEKNDGKIYVYSKKENKNLLIAVDDHNKTLNFHILEK